MSKDKMVGIGLAIWIIAGTICAFQISSLPPSVPYWTAIITNPFGIVTIIGIIIFFVGFFKKE